MNTKSGERTVGRTDKHTQKGDKMKLKMIRAKMEDKNKINSKRKTHKHNVKKYEGEF